MTSYLFLASSGELKDGGMVLNRQLSEALARDNDVHLATIGPCRQRREGVNVVELDETLLSPRATADIHQTRHFVDRFSKTIRAVLDEQGPERVGLPTGAGAFDVIVGYGDVTGPAALHLRDTYYPDAKVSTVITMDPKGLFKTIDMPELGAHRTESHREVLARSDLILAHGPKSAVDARQLAAEWSQAESLPPTHEFVPGVETAQDTPARWQRGEPFNVLMLGRMHDLNKGAADVALAVRDLREDGYEDVRLTLRGVDQENSTALVERLDRQLGAGEWQSFVEFEEFTDNQAEKERSIRESQVMVMATESEAYGLAASEYAAHGKPLIVAEGYGNGFATLLRDEKRIPSDIADRFVLDDSGSHSANGSLFGEPEGDPGPVDRYALIADRLEDVHNNYEAYADAGERLRGHLSEYTLDHTAASIDQAVNENLAGNIRHTKQGPQGVNVAPSQEELLRGIPEDKRDLVLVPRGASPQRPIRETGTPRGPAETGRRTAAPSPAGGHQGAAPSAEQLLRQARSGGSTPFDQSRAQSWLAEYWECSRDLISRGELDARTAPAMLALHSQADQVASVAYEGQDQQLGKHGWFQKVQKAVFVAGQRGVDNAALPPSPQEYYSATKEERERYVETMKAAREPDSGISADSSNDVRRRLRGLASSGTRDTERSSPDGGRQDPDSQEGPDLGR